VAKWVARGGRGGGGGLWLWEWGRAMWTVCGLCMELNVAKRVAGGPDRLGDWVCVVSCVPPDVHRTSCCCAPHTTTPHALTPAYVCCCCPGRPRQSASTS
jgi:hypothetical protein